MSSGRLATEVSGGAVTAEPFDGVRTEIEHTTEPCSGCGVMTGPADLEFVDDEFDADAPTCPSCREAARIASATCEFCDAPAEYEVELGFLCEEHHDHYVDGYRERD